ncbi:MAG: hypothetical protein QOK04_1921 [Solirubrobacteraceae bacterium]|jgi:hypothetical protein|nr:hypothetical protein [Solirubrobacteraceae bacterium]
MTRSLPARAVALGCIAGVCLLLGACGGSSGRLSRAEFVSRANAACKHANDRLRTLKPARTFKELVPAAEHLRAIGDELYARLRPLKPPSERRKKFDRFLSDLRAGVDKFSELRSAAQRGDRASAQSVLNLIAANPSGQEAQDLGLTECAKNVTAQR